MMDDSFSRFDSDGRALVVIGENRVALATVLVLQELNLSVDIALDAESAVTWSHRGAYDLIVCGPGGDGAADLAMRFRVSAPGARIFLLTDTEDADSELWMLGVELISPPLDVNTLVSRFWRTAA